MNTTGLRQTSCSERASLTADDRLAETQAIPRRPVVLPQRNASNETSNQIVGAFLMMHDVAPWEAEELERWLDSAGFHIVLKD